MKYEYSHLSDQQLLLDLEGELPARDEKPVREHLGGCWKCRARRQQLETAIADFVQSHQLEFDAKWPSAEGPRALLKAQLEQIPQAQAPQSHAPQTQLPQNVLPFLYSHRWALAASVFCVLISGLVLMRSVAVRQMVLHAEEVVVSTPDSRLTPGAALLTTRQAVCSEASSNNKVVPVALRQRVFEEYRIVRAESRAYEVDYLVTPALGGADDIRNLWPHSYSATVWNAQVKDALENRLREMVCDGSLDLGEAQRDIATDWIGAYKKYFHTEKPLAEHRPQSIQ